MKSTSTLLLGSSLLLALASSLPAQILRVPSQHATIKAALGAAKSGDTILVAAGVYKESLTWPARDGIRLHAEEGPLKTTIDANQSGRVLMINSSAITRKTVISGFTITGGLLKTTM